MPTLRAESLGLKDLIADLRKAPDESMKQARTIVEDSIGNIQQDWKARWAGLGPHLPGLARSISKEVSGNGPIVEGETGPDESGQGPLGGIIEFGSRTSGPHPGGWPALDAEEPHFVRSAENIKLTALE
jgi:hypothetical protein